MPAGNGEKNKTAAEKIARIYVLVAEAPNFRPSE